MFNKQFPTIRNFFIMIQIIINILFFLSFLTFAFFAPLRETLFLRGEWLTQSRKARQGGTIKLRKISFFFAIELFGFRIS